MGMHNMRQNLLYNSNSLVLADCFKLFSIIHLVFEYLFSTTCDGKPLIDSNLEINSTQYFGIVMQKKLKVNHPRRASPECHEQQNHLFGQEWKLIYAWNLLRGSCRRRLQRSPILS